jgi:hypothetical protein
MHTDFTSVLARRTDMGVCSREGQTWVATALFGYGLVYELPPSLGLMPCALVTPPPCLLHRD